MVKCVWLNFLGFYHHRSFSSLTEIGLQSSWIAVPECSIKSWRENTLGLCCIPSGLLGILILLLMVGDIVVDDLIDRILYNNVDIISLISAPAGLVICLRARYDGFNSGRNVLRRRIWWISSFAVILCKRYRQHRGGITNSEFGFQLCTA